MDPLDATRTPETEQFYPWRDRILFWMGHIGLEKNPLKSAPWLQSEQVTACFAVQNGGWCAASATAPKTFDKYGKSTACGSDGEGGPWANDVYVIRGETASVSMYTSHY